MRLVEEKRDVFDYAHKIPLVHCISADYAMGAGIAIPIAREFNLRVQLKNIEATTPSCVFIAPSSIMDSVFNLITKEKYWQKPTYNNFTVALQDMKIYILQIMDMIGNKAFAIAMPKIGCGIDGLDWRKVKSIIQNVFDDIPNLTIYVCYL
jgi:hypothetical protein